MWFWILVIFAIGGAILGALSSKDKDGALGGCLAGLCTGGSCLVQIFVGGLIILLTIWLFGAIFG